MHTANVSSAIYSAVKPAAVEFTATQQAYRLAFAELPGLGYPHLQPLLEGRLCAETLWKQGPNSAQALRFNWPIAPLATWAQRLKDKHYHPVKQWEAYHAMGYRVLLWGHPLYPEALAQCSNPPAVLYTKGQYLQHHPHTLAQGLTGVGVVGTRRMSDFGKEITQHLVYGLANQAVVIVSGLAEGIDTVAHQAALECGLPTIAVFGCGLNTIFPAQNEALAEAIVEEGGLLLSEFSPETPPRSGHFPKRNRIIAGLSKGVVVVEAPFKSGAMITARNALEENRCVMAVPNTPFSPNSQGPLKLIRQGASPVWESRHIIEELQLKEEPYQQLCLLADETLPFIPVTGSLLKEAPQQLTPNKATLKPKEHSPRSPSFPYQQQVSASYGTQKQPSSITPSSSVGSRILQQLQQAVPKPLAIEALAEALQLSPSQLNTELTLLQLEGQVSMLPGLHVKLT